MTQTIQTPAEVKIAYDAVADRYADKYFAELEGKPFDCKMLDWLVERVGTPELICDLGCGPGQIAHHLNARGANVCGIDLSSEMVKVASERNPGILFSQGNMLALDGVGDGAFMGIAAFYAIVNLSLEDLPRAFSEVYRVLKPGGWVLLSFHVGDETRHVDEFLERRVTLDFTFFTVPSVKSRLASAGLAVTEVMVRDPYIDAEYPSQRAYVFARKPQ
jgi:ubiquinone/menaquinone biosynthesis C-methylase UbiE